MIRKLIFIVLFWTSLATAQVVGAGFVDYVTSAPSGTCTQGAHQQNVLGSGFIYTCQSGTWAQVGAGGGGTVTSVTGTANQINVATGTTTPVLSISSTFAFPGSATAATQSQNNNSTLLSTTAYTDLAVANAIAGVNPAVAVLAASTANVVGAYTAVGAGIGDFFTVTATGSFTLDGIAINTIGQRVLLKNQADGTQNGVYFATIVGALGVSPVFTRAIDYDTPSDVNNTGTVPVQSGTANTTTSWLLTSQVTSIGPAGSALTYAKFSIAPASLVTQASSNTSGNVITGAGSQAIQDSGTALASLAPLVSPSFTTPTLGVATASSINKMAITAPATSSTLTVADGKTATINNSLTLAGTDSTTQTFPAITAGLWGIVTSSVANTDTVSCPNNTTANFATTYTIPANYLATKKVLKITLGFSLTSSSSPPSFGFQLSVGGANVYTAAAAAPSISMTNIPMEVTFEMQGSAAASGSAAVYTFLDLAQGTSTTAFTPFKTPLSGFVVQPVNLVTNGTLVVQPILFCSASTAGNSMTLQRFVVEAATSP
jgi:hypothetical protein